MWGETGLSLTVFSRFGAQKDGLLTVYTDEVKYIARGRYLYITIGYTHTSHDRQNGWLSQLRYD